MVEVTDTDRAIAQIATIFTAEMVAGYCKDARMEATAELKAENERLRGILEQWLETAREHLDTEVAGRTFEALGRAK